MLRRAHLVVLGLALSTTLGSGCFRGGGQLAFAALDVAVAVAEVAVIAAILADHDDHYHGGHCHPVRYQEGRDVYYYNGRWEYYDYDATVWYVY